VFRVQRSRRGERGGGAGFEAEAPIATTFRFIDDVPQQRRGDALAQMSRHRAHRLDLAVRVVERLQRTASEKLGPVPRTPERDVRLAQALEIQRVNALRRRVQGDAAQVQLQQLDDRVAAQIVDADVDGWRVGWPIGRHRMPRSTRISVAGPSGVSTVPTIANPAPR
jgi:hypothetical protein